VKTDSLSINQLVVRAKCSFCCYFRETYVKTKKTFFLWNQNAKARFETLKIKKSLITSFCINL